MRLCRGASWLAVDVLAGKLIAELMTIVRRQKRVAARPVWKKSRIDSGPS